MNTILGLAVMFVVACIGSGSAHAQADDETLLRQGVEFRKQGKNEDALAAFQRAYELRPSKRAMAQVALAEQALGHWARAEAGLTQVLAGAGDSWIERHRAPLMAALETIRDHLGTIEIACNVHGAPIAVNAELVGPSPLSAPLRVVAGIVQVEVHPDGMDAVRREFEVPARSTIRAEIIVLPAAPPGPEQASTLRAAVGQQAPGQQPPSEIHTRRTLRLRRAGWGLLGAAAVGLIVGGSAHFVRQARAVDYNDDARCFYGDETRDARCGSDRSAVQTAQAVAITGYAVAAAALAAGATLLLKTRSDKQSEAVRLAAHVSAQAAGVSCFVPF
jgi:hypothetical protein